MLDLFISELSRCEFSIISENCPENIHILGI